MFSCMSVFFLGSVHDISSVDEEYIFRPLYTHWPSRKTAHAILVHQFHLPYFIHLFVIL